MNKKEKEQLDNIQKTLFSSFDAIIKACKVAEETYGWGTITLPVFKKILDSGKWNIKSGVAKEFADNYNKLLMIIYEDAKLQCGNRNTMQITMQYIESTFDHFRKEYIEEMEKLKGS